MTGRFIYHITSRIAWEDARRSDLYEPEGYSREGFIHCSEIGQVRATAGRFYSGQEGLVLVEIDTTCLRASVVYENLEGGRELFPHIYGRLNLKAVARVMDFPPRQDGSFSLPVVLEDRCS